MKNRFKLFLVGGVAALVCTSACILGSNSLIFKDTKANIPTYFTSYDYGNLPSDDPNATSVDDDGTGIRTINYTALTDSANRSVVTEVNLCYKTETYQFGRIDNYLHTTTNTSTDYGTYTQSGSALGIKNIQMLSVENPTLFGGDVYIYIYLYDNATSKTMLASNENNAKTLTYAGNDASYFEISVYGYSLLQIGSINIEYLCA